MGQDIVNCSRDVTYAGRGVTIVIPMDEVTRYALRLAVEELQSGDLAAAVKKFREWRNITHFSRQEREVAQNLLEIMRLDVEPYICGDKTAVVSEREIEAVKHKLDIADTLSGAVGIKFWEKYVEDAGRYGFSEEGTRYLNGKMDELLVEYHKSQAAQYLDAAIKIGEALEMGVADFKERSERMHTHSRKYMSLIDLLVDAGKELEPTLPQLQELVEPTPPQLQEPVEYHAE